MLHLRSFTWFSIHLECWNAFRQIWSIEKVLKEKVWDIQVWVLWRSSRGRPDNALGTSQITLWGNSLESQIRTSPRRHFKTSRGRQIGTSPVRQIGTTPRRSNRIFRRRPGDVLGPSWDLFLRTGTVPLKYIGNSYRLHEMLLTNCKGKLKLKWTKYCVLSAAGAADINDSPNKTIFVIKDTKLFLL